MAKPPKTTQDEPTKPMPRDENGRAIDAFGLPVNGPARAEALGDKPDPALEGTEPEAPTPAPAPLASGDQE